MSRLRCGAAAVVIAVVAVLVPGVPALAESARIERIYVANSGSNTVSVIDKDTNAVVATVPVGERPTGVLAVGSWVYVTNQLSGTVSVIDGVFNTVVATVPVGVRPAGLDVSAYSTEVWVANEGSNDVSVISIATNAVVATVPVGVAPMGISFSGHGEHVYVTSQSDTVSVVSSYRRTVVATIPVGHDPAAIAAPVFSNGKVYVTNQSSNTVSVIDRASNTVVKTIAVGTDPTGLELNLADQLLVANKGSNTISVIDMATDTVVDTWSAVRPHGLAHSLFAEHRLYATGMGVGGVVTVLDPITGETVATVPVGHFPEGVSVAAMPEPVISGQTWFSSGARTLAGPAGSPVALRAVGAHEGLPYELILSSSREWPCLDRVATLNPTPVFPSPSGRIGTVRATIPAGTPAGDYTICFRHTGGLTATGVVGFTVT